MGETMGWQMMIGFMIIVLLLFLFLFKHRDAVAIKHGLSHNRSSFLRRLRRIVFFFSALGILVLTTNPSREEGSASYGGNWDDRIIASAP